MNRAEFMASEVVDLKYEDLPEEVIEKVKLLIVDGLGCQLAFSTLPWGEAAYKYVKMHKSQGDSTIVKYGDKVCVEDAAFANAIFMHGFEYDDTEGVTTSHPGACIVPTVLALGEDIKASGKDVILAFVAGYETELRVGRVLKTSYLRNWHGTSVPGGFAVAASASKLLGFDAQLTKDAFGVVSTEVGGNTEYSHSGGTVKRTLPATAVSAGIRSAYLAQAGITGPGEPMDGKGNVFIGCCDGEPIYEAMEVPFKGNWYTMDVGTKPYCCCQGTHALLDCAAEIREKINGDWKSIKKMTIVFHDREKGILCNIRHPETIIEAQFSAFFGSAMRMVKGGNYYSDYCEENLKDPEIAEMIEKIDVEAVPFGTLADTNGPAKLIVEMEDGTVYEAHKAYAVGTPVVPMNFDQVVDKFNSNVAPVISEEQAAAIVEAVKKLDELEDISELTKLLVAE